jgi:hypothetical protein
MEQMAFVGLIGLAVVTLIWVIYHAAKNAGKNEAKASATTTEITRVIEEEQHQDELEKASRDAADRAIHAGNSAGAAPDDPLSLPDKVRARILKP